MNYQLAYTGAQAPHYVTAEMIQPQLQRPQQAATRPLENNDSYFPNPDYYNPMYRPPQEMAAVPMRYSHQQDNRVSTESKDSAARTDAARRSRQEYKYFEDEKGRQKKHGCQCCCGIFSCLPALGKQM
ncbi:hypothetical protein TWF694_001356 [Orbilia ellipsospora]|uniref:Uncharacterized protein n=1 Tax=Orbilia ellipsospora TaxID=2528407 RepID=A0AAV9XXX7_9PEZI